MYRRLIFLSSFVLVLAVCSGALAKKTVQYKVDLCPSNYDPPDNYNGTHPGGDWLVWDAWSNIDPDHDGRTLWNVGGMGINIFMGMDGGHGHNNYDTVEGEPPDGVPGPIANGWVRARNEDDGPPGASFHIAVWGDALTAGEYRIYGYHNDPEEANRPDMPSIIAAAYCEDNQKANCGCPLADCNIGVVQIPLGEPCDINVPVQNHRGTDDALVTSEVRWISDGTPALITYEAPENSSAIFNAFIIELEVPPQACGPSPVMNKIDVCPDKVLSWFPGAYADNQDVYFGTDYNDVNDATTLYDPNNVYMGNQPVNDVNYDPGGLLDFNETYYWRVDTVNDVCAPFFWKGNVWSFTTEDGKASKPSPANPEFSVATDATVSWVASCLATHHDVYFSTDYNAVNDGTDPNSGAGQGRQEGDTFDPNGLEAITRYYWRIDEVGESTVKKGDIWAFMTIGGTLFHFKFDGVEDANVHDPGDEDHLTDSTGNVTFTIIGREDKLTYAESNPLYNTGGTSAHFASQEGASEYQVGLYRGGIHSIPPVRGVDITDLTAPQYTIEMWVKADSFYEDTRLIGKREGGYAIDLTDGGMVLFTQADSNTIGDGNSVITMHSWYHIAGVFDSNDPCLPQKLYIDGDLVAAGGTQATNPVGNDESVTIGIVTEISKGYEKLRQSFDGMIDELRVSDLALSPSQFAMRGDRGVAWFPRPKDYSRDVDYATNLTWRVGDLATSHDVYFGTDWDDVNDANTSSDEFIDNNEPNEWDPPGNLPLDKTYYWRVDEIDDSNGYMWPGRVWRFTTVNYLIVDDMESYNATDNRIYWIWDDGYKNNSGAELALVHPVAPGPVHDGTRSMKYLYDNADSKHWFLDYYSEIEVPMSKLEKIDEDWTAFGVKAFGLFFYGQPDNDTNETMYVVLEDTTGTYVQINYGEYDAAQEDMNDFRVDEWQEWRIALRDFTDVDANHIDRLYIGFGIRGNPYGSTPGGLGTVYFDDMRVYPPMCVPKYGPVADLSGDCIVDIQDVGVMGEEWLDADATLDVSNPGTGPDLVGWWKLDEGDGNDVADSSTYGNDGKVEGDYRWVGDHNAASSGFALKLRGDGSKVRVPDACELRPSAAVTAAAWVYYSDAPGYAARVVVKGPDEDDSESFALQLNNNSAASFFIRNEPNKDNLGVGGQEDAVDEDEWVHLAGSYDGNTVKCYVNGQLSDSEDVGTHTILSDTNDLCIGNREDANNRGLIGLVDEVRLYNRALLESEIAWLATDGTGLYLMESPANFYDEEEEGKRAVNFRDLDVLLDSWLDEELWPQ